MNVDDTNEFPAPVSSSTRNICPLQVVTNVGYIVLHCLPPYIVMICWMLVDQSNFLEWTDLLIMMVIAVFPLSDGKLMCDVVDCIEHNFGFYS